MVAAFLFPIGCFIYAWTLQPGITWFAPFMGLLVLVFAIFAIYLATFAYLADVYQIYASSALAGQSLCRNLAGAGFPLFTNQMYARLTVKWSNTLFGCIAAAMIPIPIVLFFWGPKIRSRSRFAKMIDQWRERQAELDQKQNHKTHKAGLTSEKNVGVMDGLPSQPETDTEPQSQRLPQSPSGSNEKKGDAAEMV